MSTPSVHQRCDDYIATWPGDNRAKVCFSYDGQRVVVTDITRGGQPKGSAGEMIAQAIRVHRQLLQPAQLRAMNVLDKQDEFGRSSKALLTDVMRNAALALGGKVIASREGQYRDKLWVEVDVQY